MPAKPKSSPLPFEVRRSPIAGFGGFATQPIRRGTRIIEYVGERISHAEADRRYDDGTSPHPHVVLFTVDSRTVIDAGVNGNEARFINHSCEPNCDPVVVKGHVYIEALRDIAEGEELTYDYNLTREGDDLDSEERFACHCGSGRCRGTQLEPLRRKRRTRSTKPQTAKRA